MFGHLAKALSHLEAPCYPNAVEKQTYLFSTWFLKVFKAMLKLSVAILRPSRAIMDPSSIQLEPLAATVDHLGAIIGPSSAYLENSWSEDLVHEAKQNHHGTIFTPT